MDEASIRVASLAEVPVWAVEALVTNAIDVLMAISLCKTQSEES
jgi:hypothetical protein